MTKFPEKYLNFIMTRCKKYQKRFFSVYNPASRSAMADEKKWFNSPTLWVGNKSFLVIPRGSAPG